MKKDEQQKSLQDSNKDNVVCNSDSSFPSSHSSTFISAYSSLKKTNINKEKHYHIHHKPLNSETSDKHTASPKPGKQKYKTTSTSPTISHMVMHYKQQLDL